MLLNFSSGVVEKIELECRIGVRSLQHLLKILCTHGDHFLVPRLLLFIDWFEYVRMVLLGQHSTSLRIRAFMRWSRRQIKLRLFRDWSALAKGQL